MSELNYERVDLVIVDPDIDIRQNIVSILYENGFKNITFGRTFRDLENLVTEGNPDLVISEADLPGGDFPRFYKFIKDLRHHEVGKNPFLPFIATLTNPTPESVQRIIAAGSDDLVAKPLSAAKLIERIRLLTRSRKPFVVTSDYIGPERRDDPNTRNSVDSFKVPNPLYSKVISGDDLSMNFDQEIANAIASVNLHKLERYSVQMLFLVNFLTPKLEQGDASDEVWKYLKRLQFVSEDTSRRLRNTKYAHISELCQSLIQVSTELLNDREKLSGKNVKLLLPLAQAIKSGFDTTEDTALTARKITGEIHG